MVGRFIKTADENIWRMEEGDVNTGERHWSGLLSVYVDDLLIAAEDGASSAAMKAIEKVWAISDVEVAGVNKPIKYCSCEIEVHPEGDGFFFLEEVPAGVDDAMEHQREGRVPGLQDLRGRRASAAAHLAEGHQRSSVFDWCPPLALNSNKTRSLSRSSSSEPPGDSKSSEGCRHRPHPAEVRAWKSRWNALSI